MTPDDLSDIWRQRQAADAAKDNNLEPENDPAWARYCAADAAIRAARPMTLAGIAVQARVLEDSIGIGHYDPDVELAAAIAEQLEALARRAPAA